MEKFVLRRGDLVEVRSPHEIMQTLDETGALEAMPFMPEMVQYCGQRFRVDRRADKVCDTINSNLQSRRLAATVLLEELRCDGAAHGGCQAECRYYWKEAWLRPVSAGEPPSEPGGPAAIQALRDLTERNALQPGEHSENRYRCQATEMVAASEHVSTIDPRPYINELTSGNVSAVTFVRVMGRAAVMQPLHRLNLLPMPPVKGSSPKSPPSTPLDLQPGEWVRVKSREGVAAMLTDKGFNRGLWFDREMVPFCGEIRQVRRRVTRIIDERTGEMNELKSDCITLEGAVCSGERSTGRWFCPREIPAYFRECWLERVDAPDGPTTREAGG